jgi:colanic acid/amylovoran biosynthesis glycosyltransferase
MIPERTSLQVCIAVRRFPVLSETYVLDHVSGLIGRGHRIRILRRREGASPSDYADYRREELEPLTKTWIPGGGRTARVLDRLGQWPAIPLGILIKLLRDPMSADLVPLAAHLGRLHPRPEIVHAHFASTGELLSILRARRACRIPLVVSVHGHDVNRALSGTTAGFPNLFRQADRIVVTSKFMQHQTERLGCPAERIARIPIGIDTGRFSFSPRQWRRSETLRLLSVARLVEQKGISRGIIAAAALARDGVKLRYTIVGDGPLRGPLEQLSRECGISDSVIFTGAQSRESVIRHYADNHVFMFPCTRVTAGDEEGQGIVLQEAQASGLPVLSTFHGGIPESIDVGRSGLLVEDDQAALNAGLNKLVTAAPEWPEYGAAGRQFVEQHFTQKLHLDRLESLYRDVLDRHTEQYHPDREHV